MDAAIIDALDYANCGCLSQYRLLLDSFFFGFAQVRRSNRQSQVVLLVVSDVSLETLSDISFCDFQVVEL